MSKEFNLKLITPEGIVYEDNIEEITLPTQEGEITVLKSHTPLVTLISPGEIIIKDDKKHHYLATEGGVAFISQGEVKILSDSAESADSLNESIIEEARKRAEHTMAETQDKEEFANAQALLEKQLAKLKVLKRRKHRL
jgi:F-type H+-transporting ATPase subunit epsilon